MGNDEEESVSLLSRQNLYKTVEDEIKSLPDFINPFRLENACVMLGYFNVGLAMYLFTSPVAYYLVNTLDCSSAQYNAFITLIGIPWTFKFLFGALSDCVPIRQSRRNSWFFIGWTGFVLSSLWLSLLSNPSLVQVSFWMFVMTCAYLLSDVCADAHNVERAKFETESIKGKIQASSYAIRSFGSVIGAVLGAVLYNSSSWGWGLTISQFFLLGALLPATTLLPVSPFSLEIKPKSTRYPSFHEIVMDIWRILQLRVVWHPMIFIFSYNMLQVSNASWTNFLVEGKRN
jgi:MFS family permease